MLQHARRNHKQRNSVIIPAIKEGVCVVEEDVLNLKAMKALYYYYDDNLSKEEALGMRNLIDDFEDETVAKLKRKKPTQCCGVYPYRYPYAEDEEHKCCGGKTYNTVHKKCCGGEQSGRPFNPLVEDCCTNQVSSIGTC